MYEPMGRARLHLIPPDHILFLRWTSAARIFHLGDFLTQPPMQGRCNGEGILKLDEGRKRGRKMKGAGCRSRRLQLADRIFVRLLEKGVVLEG